MRGRYSITVASSVNPMPTNRESYTNIPQILYLRTRLPGPANADVNALRSFTPMVSIWSAG
jgi:hypothetical protein